MFKPPYIHHFSDCYAFLVLPQSWEKDVVFSKAILDINQKNLHIVCPEDDLPLSALLIQF